MVEDKQWQDKVKKLVNKCKAEDMHISGELVFWFEHGQQVVLDKVYIYETSQGWYCMVNGKTLMERGKWVV